MRIWCRVCVILDPLFLRSTTVSRKCKFNHDIASYLEAKPADLHIPSASELQSSPPFVVPAESAPGELAPGDICVLFAETGECRYGYKCRFLRSHIRRLEDGSTELVKDEDKIARTAISGKEVNFVGADVQKRLRSKKVSSRAWSASSALNGSQQYPFPIADAYMEEQARAEEAERARLAAKKAQAEAMAVDGGDNEPVTSDEKIQERTGEQASAEAQNDTPDVPTRPSEKKRLHWAGKSCECLCMSERRVCSDQYADLAPLTTVGNLVRHIFHQPVKSADLL